MKRLSRLCGFVSLLALISVPQELLAAPSLPKSFDPGAQGVALLRPISVRDPRQRELKKGFDALYAKELTPASKLVVYAPKAKQVMVLYPNLAGERGSIRLIDIMGDPDWKLSMVGAAGGDEVTLAVSTGFRTHRGLKLGDSVQIVGKTLGKPVESEGDPKEAAQWTYVISGAEMEKAPLNEFKMSEYRATYEFRKGRLTRISFGFTAQ